MSISSRLLLLRRNVAFLKPRACSILGNVRLASQCALPSVTGLLGPTASDAYYSSKLELVGAAELVQRRGYLWQAAQMDAAAAGETADDYLSRVHKGASAFVAGGKLHDREDIVVSLQISSVPTLSRGFSHVKYLRRPAAL